jgi:hypothetical protein
LANGLLIESGHFLGAKDQHGFPPLREWEKSGRKYHRSKLNNHLKVRAAKAKLVIYPTGRIMADRCYRGGKCFPKSPETGFSGAFY